MVLGPHNDIYFVKRKNQISDNFVIMNIVQAADTSKKIETVYEHHCPILELQLLDHDDLAWEDDKYPLKLGLIDSEYNFIILGKKEQSNDQL